MSPLATVHFLANTFWSECRHDGMLFGGHSRFRGGQAWNNWALFEWKYSVLDKDGVSYITTIGTEGKIHGFIDLQDPQSFDFDMFHNRLIPTLQKGRHTIYAIIQSLKKPSTATFPKSIIRKGELESWGCDGRRGLNLVDVNAISDVAFGVPNIGGNANEFLFRTQLETWANRSHP